MRRDVTIELTGQTPEGAVLLAPKPVAFWDQRFEGFDAGGLTADTLAATNSAQEAYQMRPNGAAPRLSYAFAEAPGAAADATIWACPENRLTQADDALAALAAELCPEGDCTQTRLSGLIAHAAEMFDYDHPEERFNDGTEAVPVLCGTTKGSCVDINTFVLAGALSQGITGQYFAGYWFGPGRFTTPDMHCWLGFEAGGAPVFWDVAHHLKWGVSPLAPGLNPAGGRRVALSAGRGLAFETANGPVTISHFSEPLWVLPDGALLEPEIRISLEESDD